MAIKASASITLTSYRDIESVTRYYKLQSSTATAPSVPTTNPPSGWTTTEPSYTSASTNSLYLCDLTVYSDGTFTYTPVSKSSSYEAAKEAWNKAQNAQDSVDNLEIGGRNLVPSNYLDKGISRNGTTKEFIASAWAAIIINNSYTISILEPSTEYVLSYDAELVERTDLAYKYDLNCGFLLYSPTVSSANIPVSCGVLMKETAEIGDKGHVSKVFTTPSELPSDYILLVYTRRWTSKENGAGTAGFDTIKFTNFKLEKGNKATDWTPAPEDVDGKIEEVSNALDASMDVIIGTQTATTGSWTGVAKFSELKDGQRIAYWLPYDGSGNATLNLTLADGSMTGAKNCYYGGTTRITTHYPAGSVIHLTYRENVSIAGSSTKYTGWWGDANYDSGNTYDRIRYYKAIKAGTTAIVATNIVVAKDGTYTHLKLGNVFDVTYPILYASSAISASSTGTNNYISIPFTVSTTQSITLTAYKPVYIKGTMNGTLVTPISTSPLTQTVPTSEDGYQYILLGTAYSTTGVYLLPEHPIFQYFNGGFKTIQQIAVEASKVATNYMNFDETDGLVVGNMTAETLGNNVRIDSDSVDIRSGSNVLATFASDLIELGKNAVTSVIDLCKGVGQIKADKDSSSDSIFNRLWIIAKKSLILRGQSVDISCTTQHNNPSQEYANSAFGSVSCTTGINEDLGTVSSQSSLSATCVENGDKAIIRAATNGSEGVGSGEIYLTTDGIYGEEGIYMNSSYFGVSTRDSQLTLSSEGIGSTTSVKITNKNKGYYLTDSSGASYPGVCDNGLNLWIGSSASNSVHHVGKTYISSGYNGSAGNLTIYVAVPNASNNNSELYGVFHAGYLDVGKATTGTLPIARGGTGGTTATDATTNLEAMRSPYKNGYRGMATPGNNENDWIRTTSYGLIPYKSGGGSSALGTANWPFSKVYSQNYYGGGDILLFSGNVLYQGNLAAGGSFETALYRSYKCFVAILSNWTHVMGYRWDLNAGISMSGMTDEGAGSGSWSHKASFSAVGLENGNVKLTLVAASTHKLLSSGTSHEGYTRNVLYVLGIF